MSNTPIDRAAAVSLNMTDRQKEFASAVASGSTYKDAYKLAYSADNMSDGSIATESSRVANNPKVKAYTEALARARRVEHVAPPAPRGDITMEWVMAQLRDEATDDENPPSVRVTALRAMKDTLEKKLTNSETRSIEDMERELLRRLSKLSGGTDAFDA